MKCWECGKEATKTRNLSVPYKMFGGTVYSEAIPNSMQRCYCNDCFDRHISEVCMNDNLYIRLKKKRMYEAAVDKLEHQRISFVDYERAIKHVGKFVDEYPDAFDSSYEMIAAIMLVHNNIKCKPQYKIGAYQVDFLLPDKKVILEIDGERHQYNKDHDRKRDVYIKQALGSEWNIIRIQTELLDQHADRLGDAIEKVIDYRKTGRVSY